MRTTEANSILEKVIQSVESNGIDAGAIIPELQKAREYALKEEDPLLGNIWKQMILSILIWPRTLKLQKKISSTSCSYACVVKTH